MILFLTININAQNSLTNTLNGVYSLFPDYISQSIADINVFHKIRICSESINPYDGDQMLFTNVVFSQVLEKIIGIYTNHVWKYENETNSFYIYPKTNSFMMTRVGPISITNELVKNLFYEDNFLGFGKIGLELYPELKWSWTDEVVSLEFEEAYVWEVLDAIDSQLPYKGFWMITDNYVRFWQSTAGYMLKRYGAK